MVAQIVDHLADRHMFGHRDQVALHQATGGFLRVGQRAFDRRAIFGVERVEDGLLVGIVHILDHRDGIVGVEFGRESRHLFRRKIADQVLADIIVEFGQHFRADQVAERRRHRAAPVGGRKFEQVGNVGRMQRRHEIARPLGVAIFHRVEHGGHIFGSQPVILVMTGIGLIDRKGVDQLFIGPGIGHIAAIAHGARYCPVPESWGCFRPCSA